MYAVLVTTATNQRIYHSAWGSRYWERSILSHGDRYSPGDFDTLSAAGNANPRGMWSDGTTLWVADNQDNKLYAYTVSTKAHISSKDISLTGANSNAYGVWSDGTTIWVSDIGGRVYAYTLSSGAYDSTKDITGLPNPGGTRGIWSDGTTLWVANQNDDKGYAFVLSSGARDSAKDMETLSAAGNGSPRGMTGTAGYILISDNADNKVYVYNESTKAHKSSGDVDLDLGNSSASGVWVLPSGKLLVGDQNGEKIYAYTWNLEGEPLPAPTPVVSNVSPSRSLVTWTAVTNATSYDMRHKKQADATWTETAGVTSPRSLTGLDAGTAYEVQLRSMATGYATGAWSASTDFTTLNAGLAAPTPSVGSITQTGASVSWTAVTNATSYDMRLKKQADSTWTETTGVTSPRSLTGLDAGTAYEVQLRSMATGYATGAWSSSTDFTTTLNAALSPTPVVGSITQTGASVSWTGVTNATSYDMRLKKQADSTWTTTTGVTSPRSLTGLDAGTAYEVQLRSQASGYATGAWSSSVSFTTLPPPTPTPAPTPTPTPVPLRSVAYLGTVQIAVGNAGGTYGYMADGYGGLVAGRFPGELFTDGRSRPAAEVSVSGGNVLQLTYGDETDSLFHGAFHLRWLRAQFRTADGMVRDEANLWSSTPCGVRSICVSGMSGLSGYSGQVVGLDFFDAQTEVLASSAGGKERIIFAAGAVGADATGFDASAGALMSGVFPGQWFSDNRPRTPEKVSVSHGNANRRLELAYDSGQDEGLWQTELRAYRTYRLSLRDRDGVLLQQWDMQDILGASSESVRRCGDTAPARRICLPYDDDELDLAEYREQAMVLQVEDITWFSMLKATPAGPVGAQLGLGLFGAGFFAFMARRAKSPQREMTVLFAGVAASALPALIGYGSVFWPVVILIIAALAAAGWFFFTKSR